MKVKLRMFVENVPPEFLNDAYKEPGDDYEGPTTFTKPQPLPIIAEGEVEAVPRLGDDVWASELGTQAVERVLWNPLGILLDDGAVAEVELEPYVFDPYADIGIAAGDMNETFALFVDVGWEIDWSIICYPK